jgi:hypothetical protein
VSTRATERHRPARGIRTARGNGPLGSVFGTHNVSLSALLSGEITVLTELLSSLAHGCAATVSHLRSQHATCNGCHKRVVSVVLSLRLSARHAIATRSLVANVSRCSGQIVASGAAWQALIGLHADLELPVVHDLGQVQPHTPCCHTVCCHATSAVQCVAK